MTKWRRIHCIWSPSTDPEEVLVNILGAVGALEDGGVLNRGESRALVAKVSAAEENATRGRSTAALNQMGALINQIHALELSGRLDTQQARTLREATRRVMALLAAVYLVGQTAGKMVPPLPREAVR